MQNGTDRENSGAGVLTSASNFFGFIKISSCDFWNNNDFKITSILCEICSDKIKDTTEKTMGAIKHTLQTNKVAIESKRTATIL